MDASGAFCHHSATWRGTRPTILPPDRPQDPPKTLPGRHLYAGQLWSHFGHFLTESLSRLWALDDLADLPDSILYIPKRPQHGRRRPRGFQAQVLDVLGVKIPVHVVRRPTRVEQLLVPGQGFGMGEIGAGTAKFRQYIRKNLGAGIAADGPEKLYLSRSRLGGVKGGALLEQQLEQHLAQEGYSIYHAETQPLPAQIAAYKAAKMVVGLDGSAFHLFGFLASPAQKSAIILRRSSNVYKNLSRQIAGFSGTDPLIVNAVSADWIPDHTKRPGRSSVGQLNFEALHHFLHKAGFISGQTPWTTPEPEAFHAALLAQTNGNGLAYIRKPTGAQFSLLDPT